jgi:DNA (cytosine-5)-methyltransferase 1
MRFSCVDAFSGAGGLSLGLHQAGFDVRLSFDFDSLSIETQKLNGRYFSPSHIPLAASIQEMLGGNLLKRLGLKRGDLALLAGGPPCQGFSIQRIGEDDDKRNDLVHSFIKLVEEIFPRFFLMENVPGLLGQRGKETYQAATKMAAKLGYFVHAQILDAADFGVPQRRRRVFVVGERIDSGLERFEFPIPNTPENSRIPVRKVISHLPIPPMDGSDHPMFMGHRRDRVSALNMRRLKALGPGQDRQNLPASLLADCHKQDASVIGHRHVYGRMSWDEVAPTITARFDSFTRGQFAHPEQNRTISLREGALLQTFPEDYIFAGNKVDIARQIGNAVPPTLAKSLGRQILKALKSR